MYFGFKGDTYFTHISQIRPLDNQLRACLHQLDNSKQFEQKDTRSTVSCCGFFVICDPFELLLIVDMAEISTPICKRKIKRISELKERENTPVKIPASPLMKQIGFGTGTCCTPCLLVFTKIVNNKHIFMYNCPL